MTRTGQLAVDYTRSRVGNGPPPPAGMPDDGLCLQFVREDFAVAAKYASAIDAWHACAEPHPGDRNPPQAVPLWFLTPSIYDHVVFGGDAGEIVTTFNDDVRRYTGSPESVIAAIERDFDGTYLGWGADINGVRVYYPEEEEDMSFTDADRNVLEHTNALLQETPFRTAQQVHFWQVSRVSGAPTTFLQDQTDGVSNTYTLVSSVGGLSSRSTRSIVLLILAVVFLLLVLALPFIVDLDDAARPFLAVLAALAGAIAILAALGGRDPHPTPPTPVQIAPAEPS